MREIRTYGSEGGEAQTNAPSLPLSRGADSKQGRRKDHKPFRAKAEFTRTGRIFSSRGLQLPLIMI